MKKLLTIAATIFFITGISTQAGAVVYGGVDFPDGSVSFADSIIDYSPVIKSGQPTSPYRDASEALGIPDHTSGEINFVSLGDGGSITIQFTDNSLTGSDSTDLDLWIFEIGPDIEDTFVEISKDNSTWHDVGLVTGSTSGIDIDFFGFTSADQFSFVRLTDHPDRDGQSGDTVGADIDAIGAISSGQAVPNPTIPEPTSMLLLGSGLLGLAGFRRRS